jgi:hypothetical protein
VTEPERTTPTIEQRVAAGAEWLDANLPEWVEKVDLGQLRLLSPCLCILGQAFGDFYTAPLPQEGDARDAVAADLGFLASVEIDEGLADSAFDAYDAAEQQEYRELHAEWTRLILARRAASHA